MDLICGVVKPNYKSARGALASSPENILPLPLSELSEDEIDPISDSFYGGAGLWRCTTGGAL